ARLVGLRLNGMDLSFHGDGQFGVYAHVEVINSDFARRHYPLDDNGNVYECTRFNTDLRYLGADSQRYRDFGYHKRSNESLDDWSDLIGLTLALSSSTSDDDYLDTVSKVADIRMWVRYFAVTVLQEYAETALATGVGDDYSLYRGDLDPRFRVVPHDFDSILGEGDFGGDVSRPILISTRLTSIKRFLDHPQIRSLFFEELARLMETVFSPESVDAMLDNRLDGVVPPSVIQRMKTFNRRRNENVRLQIESLGVVLPSDLPGLIVELPTGRLPGVDENPDVIIPPKAGLRLCEILAVNRTTLNHQDRYPDWIEICNTGQNTISLDSVGLDDDLDFEDAFQFPPGVLLAPGERLVVFDGVVLNGTPIRLGFGLSGSGDSVFLTDGMDSQRVIVDQVVFGDQIADHSIALFEEEDWRLARPTPGTNNEPATTGFPDQLRINEWLAVGGKAEEFVEIFNQEALPVNMGGLYLSDQPLGRPNRQIFPPLSFVEGKGFFRASDLNFRLKALQGRLGLFSQDLRLIDFVQYGLQRRSVSRGRFPDGNSTIVSLIGPSLGKPNSALAQNLQILEVYPGEDHLETNKEALTGWLELWNPSEVSVSVNDYFLKSDPEGDRIYPFAEAIEIPPLERLIVGWPGGFFLDELKRISVPGSMGGRVSLIRLNQDGLSVVADQVSFGHLPSGYSLSRNSIDSDLWQLSRPTPGKVNQVVPMGNRTHLRINEWSAASGRSEDWIEIFNSASLPVDLGGCFLTDNPDDSRSFEIPSYTYLADGPDAFLTLRAEQSLGGELPALSFGLNTEKESVWLLGPRGNLIDFITFENLQPDQTEGRLPDGGGALFRFPNSGSPGRSNNADSDQNGLPDAWEQLFGLKPQPGGDTDLDGRTDHAEFLDGTDPTDPLSHFGFDALDFHRDFGSRLSLTAVSGQSYGIFYQNRLGGSRSLLQAVFANPISQLIEIDDPESRFHDQRFYQMLSPMPAVPGFRGDTALSFVMNQTAKSMALEIEHSRYDIDQLSVKWTISDPGVFPDERVSVRLEDDWILEVSPEPFQTGSAELEVTVTDPAGFSTMKTISLLSVDPGRHDWNHDGWEDMFFQEADGDLWVWFLEDFQANEAHPPDAEKLRGSQWRVAGIGEFNQDGHPDLLLEHPGGDS
ncbi:MAG TPA: hypothetical protein EYG38_21510, partial [Verrucomicrobia bacterium]|nr:hypothetical protein [Verrucomicrobiota bacterium]